MALDKITQEEVSKHSVVGMPDVPGLPAAEMQAKIEEVVREVAIKKINEIIEWLSENGATKEDLNKIAFESGSVLSVFGRSGRIVAQKGDYTPEMVGAAAIVHGRTHRPGGADDIGFVAREWGAESTIRKKEITLSASGWSERVVPTQNVEIEGATAFDKVDAQANSAVINQMLNDGIVAIYFGNENGVITAYAVGGTPTADITLQITLTEVS